MTKIRTVSLALSCALIALAAGLWLGGHPDSLPGPIRDAVVSEDQALRAEIIDAIEDSYFRKVGQEQLDAASLKGIVRALDDPFSHYLTAKEATEFRQAVSGKFEGVGMTVEEDPRGLRVVNAFERSPARKAGIHKGDLITAVNGKSLAGVNSEVATGRIKGPAGTQVKLRVIDIESRRPRTVTVRRARIEVPVAEGKLETRDRKSVV